MKAMVWLLGVILGIPTLLILVLYGASELGGEVVTLDRTESSGDVKQVRIWIVDANGTSWIEHGDPESSYIARLAQSPNLVLKRGGSPGELYGSVPELADICNLKTEKLFGVLSENMGPEYYRTLASRCAEAIEAGADGIVIGHGTDTMHHTAAVLTFMLQGTPVPIVLVGSQRSSDRPSSDAALCLINAVKTAAESDIAEVVICMFGPTSDQYCLLHRGTRARKMHSSYRSTFRTIGDIPLALVAPDSITMLREDYKRRRCDGNITLDTSYCEDVTLLYYYPGMKPDVMEALIEKGYKGIVIAGTGLGHVNRTMYPALKDAQDAGVPVYMTVQTIWGYVGMYVYETGREMMDLGVVPLGNMLPEVAFIKLSWVLGQTDDRDEVKRLMLQRVGDEMTDREPYNGYLLFQGGIPEVQDFIRSIKR